MHSVADTLRSELGFKKFWQYVSTWLCCSYKFDARTKFSWNQQGWQCVCGGFVVGFFFFLV